MTRSMRFLSTLALLLTGFAACVEIEHATKLNSDGSGKFVLTMSINKEILGLVPTEESPFEEFEDPNYYAENSQGVAAWEIGERVEDGDMLRYSVVAWFEDINQVVLENNLSGSDMDGSAALRSLTEEERSGVRFTFATEKGMSTLNVENLAIGPLRQLENAPDLSDPESMEYQMAQMMAEMMEGLVFDFSITLPGPVIQSQGFLKQDDRRVSIRIDDELIVGMNLDEAQTATRGKLLSFKDLEATTATWKEVAVDAEEVALFRNEMRAAKAAWDKRLAEANAENAEPTPK